MQGATLLTPLTGLGLHAVCVAGVAVLLWLVLRPAVSARALALASAAWIFIAGVALLFQFVFSALAPNAFGPFEWARRGAAIAAAVGLMLVHPAVRTATHRTARAGKLAWPVLALGFAPLGLGLAGALSPLPDALGYGASGGFVWTVFVYTAIISPLAFGLMAWGVVYPLIAVGDAEGGQNHTPQDHRAPAKRALAAGVFAAAILAIGAGTVVTPSGVLVLKLVVATSFVTGLYLAFLRWLTGALWPPILAQVLLTGALVLA